MKALWNDYWSKWNKERVGEELRRNVFLYTWFGLLIAPVVNHCIFAEWIPGILMGMVSGICIEFVMLSTVLHPIGLSKAQYLFPMTEDERRKKMIPIYVASLWMVCRSFETKEYYEEVA